MKARQVPQQGPTTAISLPENHHDQYVEADNVAFALLLLLLITWVYRLSRQLRHQVMQLQRRYPPPPSAFDQLLDAKESESEGASPGTHPPQS
jgi:hypothetical protein